MRRFEYAIYRYKPAVEGVHEEDWVIWLNGLGAEGWQAVGVRPPAGRGGAPVFLMMRETQPDRCDPPENGR